MTFSKKTGRVNRFYQKDFVLQSKCKKKKMCQTSLKCKYKHMDFTAFRQKKNLYGNIGLKSLVCVLTNFTKQVSQAYQVITW